MTIDELVICFHKVILFNKVSLCNLGARFANYTSLKFTTTRCKGTESAESDAMFQKVLQQACGVRHCLFGLPILYPQS